MGIKHRNSVLYIVNCVITATEVLCLSQAMPASLSALNNQSFRGAHESLESMQERLKRVRWKQDRLQSIAPQGSPGCRGDLVAQMGEEAAEFVGEILLSADRKSGSGRRCVDCHVIARAIESQQLRAEVGGTFADVQYYGIVQKIKVKFDF
jgi:hypothetical protein